MLYQAMVMLHVLGACVWIGGHAVLVTTVLPRALRENNAAHVLDFERGFGRIGLGALVLQLLTGLWLAGRWIGDWSAVFSEPTPQAHLVLSKLVILTLTFALAGFAHHVVLPRIAERGLGLFAPLAGVVTLLAVVMLVLGVGIRTGGF